MDVDATSLPTVYDAGRGYSPEAPRRWRAGGPADAQGRVTASFAAPRRRLEARDPRGSPASPRRYTVHSVKHVVTDESDRIVARCCLNLTPFAGDRSPIWGRRDPLA